VILHEHLAVVGASCDRRTPSLLVLDVGLHTHHDGRGVSGAGGGGQRAGGARRRAGDGVP
jgi:hypothetical protein